MKDTKFKSVLFSNRKKQLTVEYNSGKKVTVHFGQLGICQNIAKAWVDGETKRRSVGFELEDGSKEYMPYDQPLALVQDPEFLLQTHIEIVISRIREELKIQNISKRYLAERLGTSDNQIQRLLNPDILNKNLEQLYKIAKLLRFQFEFRPKSVA